MGELVRSQQCFQFVTCLPFLKNLNNKGKNKQWKKVENKEMNNLEPWLTVGFPNHELFFKLFFFVKTNWFSFQNDAMYVRSQFDLSLSWTLI